MEIWKQQDLVGLIAQFLEHLYHKTPPWICGKVPFIPLKFLNLINQGDPCEIYENLTTSNNPLLSDENIPAFLL